jgi:hypothetical protein
MRDDGVLNQKLGKNNAMFKEHGELPTLGEQESLFQNIGDPTIIRTKTYAKPESYFRPPRAHQALPEPAGLARSRDYDLQWKEIFCGVARS